MAGITFSNKEEAKKFNELARHQMMLKLLADIRIDLEICKLEGWDTLEYLNELKELINSLGAQPSDH